MNKSNISWEIVLAGLAFIGIGIYLFNHNTSSSPKSSSAGVWHSEHEAPQPPSPTSLPGAIVIDLDNLESLQNLENLKNLRNLKNLENLKDLEIELKNLDKLIEKHTQRDQVQESVEKNLKELETELQKIEKADFNVKLRNQKVYINKNYNVVEAQWSEVSPGVFVFRESFPVDNIQSMDLELGFGNLNIVGSNRETGEITLRATGNVEDPANFSKRLNIQKNLTAPGAKFSVTSAGGNDISDRINLEATLTLPNTAKVVANTAGGHINANNLRNQQNLTTSGGHITLSSIEGETVAETDGGHITCDRISGNTILSTGGGHIKVNKSSGSLTAKTGGGHIEIQQASGSVIAKTSGGNISSTIQQADGPLKFSTSAGNITLGLPETIQANLDITGSSVSLSDAFNFSGNQNKGSISGTINKGGVPVVVSCGYGNATINTNQ